MTCVCSFVFPLQGRAADVSPPVNVDTMTKYRTIIIIVFLLILQIVVVIKVRYWREQKQEQFRIAYRDATRYAGATSPVITEFDEINDRWIAELKAETIEETLPQLTDAMEYTLGIILNSSDVTSYRNEEWREQSYYQVVAKAILSNRRFRKAYEDLQKTNKKKAATLLTKNIKDNLAELRLMLQEDLDVVTKGEHTQSWGVVRSYSSDDTYRPMSHPDYPPTPTGRKYAIFSYLLLASLLELREVRPAVEEVIALAKEEYKLFNSLDTEEARSFKSSLLEESIYNPSLLVTAAFCDPTWKVAEKKRLAKEKLVEREVVDYQARALEGDKLAREGWIPVVPHDGMLKIRYYKEITDVEFNDFFGK